MEITTVSQWATFVVAVIGALAAFVRVWSKIHTANNDDKTRSETTNQLLTNLRNEITRLNGRIGELEKSINDLRNLEIQGATDFGALEVIVNTMPCATCKYQGEAFVQLSDVLDRMNARRAARHNLIGIDDKQ